MTKLRSIHHTIKAVKVNMDGFFVDQPMPHPTVNMVDPFLLIHHADKTFPPGAERSMGVGPHPHRGFSPVTLVFEGSIHHRDSRGNSSIVHAGGTQWMNAGRGIIHSERPSKELAEKGGTMEIIQFWVNSPASGKMTDPQYIALQKEETPLLPIIKGEGEARIVAGKLGSVTGPVKTITDLLVVRFELQAGDSSAIPLSENHNALLYILDGDLQVNQKDLARRKTMVVFNRDGKTISLKAESNTRFILLAGQPIEEKVVKYGPYVLNSDQEIWEAMRDYRMGKMGFLVEEFD